MTRTQAGRARGRAKALLVTGPTASGKSAFALAAARERNGVIINADSMQVYAELSVLTARPTPAEEAAVPHRLYGHVSVREPYSVGRWLGEVADAISQAHAHSQLPIIVGGTGLYFKALIEGLSPIPPIPAEIRNIWRAAATERPAEALFSELERRDPLTARQLRPNDRQRLVRALEVFEATGRPLAEWQTVKGTPLLAEDEAAKVVISHERQVLYERCAVRFDQMLEGGALKEAELFVRMQLDPDLPASRALGLVPLMRFLAREISRDEAVALAKRDTRRYIKRQLTWLRRHMISWKHLPAQEVKKEIDRGFPVVDFVD